MRPRYRHRRADRRGSPLAGRRAWVIGASSGIGAATARELAARGARVAVSARRAADLADVAARVGADFGAVPVVPVDVGDAAGVVVAHEAVRRALDGLDLVLWCAGYWKQTDATRWDAAEFAKHVEVNLLGLNHVLAAVLPAFVADRGGHLVGVASVAGYRGLPGGEAYGTTKAAQIHLFEALRGALTPSGVRVTTVAPGFVDTPMTRENEFPMPFLIDAPAAARAICDGLERGTHPIVFPRPVAALAPLARLVPARAWTALTRSRPAPDPQERS